jgi:hypothetical protein
VFVTQSLPFFAALSHSGGVPWHGYHKYPSYTSGVNGYDFYHKTASHILYIDVPAQGG